MRFPNLAGGNPAINNPVLEQELNLAGIPEVGQTESISPHIRDILLKTSGEVKTTLLGVLHGWEFKRAWCYWMARGPGLNYHAAMKLHKSHGGVVRVNGHCGCPSPKTQFQGLAVGIYHVDTPEGLRALANAIRSQVEEADRETTLWSEAEIAIACVDVGISDSKFEALLLQLKENDQ